MFTTAAWDKLRIVGLAALVAYAIREWFKSSVRRRGQQLTRRLLIRVAISAGAGLAISLLSLGLAHYSRNHDVLTFPMVPGFLLAAIAVGVHRDDKLILYVTALLNAALYGAIVFTILSIFRREKHLRSQ